MKQAGKTAAAGVGTEKKDFLSWYASFLSLLFGFAAQLCFKFQFNMFFGVVLYALAAALFVRGLREEGGRLESGKLWPALESRPIEWTLLAALLLVAAFFRLYRLDAQPSSLWLDESLTGLNALEIIEGKSAPIWGMTPLNRWDPSWVKTSNLYLYYVVLNFKIFGAGTFGVKMISVVPAVAGVMAAYFLFKRVAHAAVAFIAAFLMAVSQWHVTISRWGWDEILMSFLQLASYGFLIKGIELDKKNYLVAAGALMGLCLYTYVASWIALAIAAVYLVLGIFRERSRWRAHCGNLLLFLIPCAIVFAPLGFYYAAHPHDLVVRAETLSIGHDIKTAHSPAPLWESAAKYAGMFNYRGDANGRHGFPDAPVLDFTTSIFFAFGLLSFLCFWKKSHNLFLLLWFFLGLQGGLLSEPTAAPHAYRTAMIIPAACLFAGAAIYFFAAALARSLPALRLRRALPAGAAITVLVIIAATNYRTYFVSRPNSVKVWEDESADGGVPATIQAIKSESRTILLDPALVWRNIIAGSWILNYRPGKLFDSPYAIGNIFVSDAIARGAQSSELFYLSPPEFVPMIREIFPEARGKMMMRPTGEPLYSIAGIKVADWRKRLETADRKRLTSIARQIAAYYKDQIPTAEPYGPRIEVLAEESRKMMERAKQVDPGFH